MTSYKGRPERAAIKLPRGVVLLMTVYPIREKNATRLSLDGSFCILKKEKATEPFTTGSAEKLGENTCGSGHLPATNIALLWIPVNPAVQ